MTQEKQEGTARRCGLWSIGLAWVTVALMAACQEERILFDGPDYVRFTDSMLVYKESYGMTVPVEVHLVGKAKAEPVTISYTVGGTATEGRDYTIEGTKGTLVIPANAYKGVINVNLINNANNILRSQDIVLTLQSATTPGAALLVGAGKKNQLGSSLRLTIRDDCLFGGFYRGKRKGYGGEVKDVEISSSNCTDYFLANWNIGILTFNADRLTLQFRDNGDNSLTIPSQYNGALGDSLSGNGAWDPRTRDIVLNVVIKTKTQAGNDTLINIPQLTYTPR